jgi:hypothetical protein
VLFSLEAAWACGVYGFMVSFFHITPQEFMVKWHLATLKKRSAYQQHFLDICEIIGQTTPAGLDPKGSFFCFEASAEKVCGSEGWADVSDKGRVAYSLYSVNGLSNP